MGVLYFGPTAQAELMIEQASKVNFREIFMRHFDERESLNLDCIVALKAHICCMHMDC